MNTVLRKQLVGGSSPLSGTNFIFAHSAYMKADSGFAQQNYERQSHTNHTNHTNHNSTIIRRPIHLPFVYGKFFCRALKSFCNNSVCKLKVGRCHGKTIASQYNLIFDNILTCARRPADHRF